MENDQGPPCLCWPFRGVAWICTLADAMRHFTPENKSNTAWGNCESFAIYWYVHAALLWRPAAECPASDTSTIETTLPFAFDVKR